MAGTEEPQRALADIHAELEAAGEKLAGRQRLLARHERLEAELGDAEQVVATARAELGKEEADVAKLESFSAARIWSGLRGDRDADLDRERSEQQAAEYAVAVAEHRRDLTVAELDAVRRRLGDLADAPRLRDEALRAKEEWVRAHGGSGHEELAEIGEGIGSLRAERGEIIEALHAAAAALTALDHASHGLHAAEASSSADDILGGLTYAQKSARIDEATRWLHHANAVLHHLNHELADTGQTAVEYLWIDRIDRTFEFSFESVFLPRLSEKQRIATAQQQVGAARGRVVAADGRLRVQLADADARLAAMTARREELLVP